MGRVPIGRLGRADGRTRSAPKAPQPRTGAGSNAFGESTLEPRPRGAYVEDMRKRPAKRQVITLTCAIVSLLGSACGAEFASGAAGSGGASSTTTGHGGGGVTSTSGGTGGAGGDRTTITSAGGAGTSSTGTGGAGTSSTGTGGAGGGSVTATGAGGGPHAGGAPPDAGPPSPPCSGTAFTIDSGKPQSGQPIAITLDYKNGATEWACIAFVVTCNGAPTKSEDANNKFTCANQMGCTGSWTASGCDVGQVEVRLANHKKEAGNCPCNGNIDNECQHDMVSAAGTTMASCKFAVAPP